MLEALSFEQPHRQQLNPHDIWSVRLSRARYRGREKVRLIPITLPDAVPLDADLVKR